LALFAPASTVDPAVEDPANAMRFASGDSVDPALEIRVDESQSPVTVRLIGVLDRGTSAGLLSTMGDLLLEGFRTFVMDTGEVEITDPSGSEALNLCQRRARELGGTLLWDEIDFGQLSMGTPGGRIDSAPEAKASKD
jgi:hypothetical protein